MRLRGHHLLCLHGFRGEGYSPEFVANMYLVRDRLRVSPALDVELLASPDDICAACPHLCGNACIRKDEGSEERMREKDLAVLSRLGFSPGDEVPSRALFGRVAEVFGDGEIGDLCSSCRWYPLGWCSEGLRKRSMSP